MDDIKTISISLLSPTLDALLFRDLPKIVSMPIERVKWHYNPLCRGCRYESECGPKAQTQGELGSMPNISIDDAKVLKDLLRVSRISGLRKSDARLPDIEELHELVGNTVKLDNIAKTSPTVVKRAKQILTLPKKVRVQQVAIQSPVVEAARTKAIQVSKRPEGRGNGHTHFKLSRSFLDVTIRVRIKKMLRSLYPSSTILRPQAPMEIISV